MSDIEYYADPDPVTPKVWQDMLTTAGVANGYVVLRDADGEVEEVLSGTLISEGDGRFHWQPSDD